MRQCNGRWFTPPFRLLAQYFATRIGQYDFWDDTEIWEVLGHYGKAVRHFMATGNAAEQKLETAVTDYEKSRGEVTANRTGLSDRLCLFEG